MAKLSDEKLIQELLDNLEYLDDYQQEFIKSVSAQFQKTGKVSEEQRDWLEYYYDKLEKEMNVS